MNPLPLPVRLAAGLVATAVEQARDLPRHVVEFPVTAVSQALQASMRVQQKVTELAIKGDRALGALRPAEERAGLGRRSTTTEPPQPQRREHASPSCTSRPRPSRRGTPRRAAGRRRRPAHDRAPTVAAATATAVAAGPRGAAPTDRRSEPPATTTRPARTSCPATGTLTIPQLRGPAAPPERGGPAGAAGLGDGARRPAAVRHDARPTGSPRSPRGDREPELGRAAVAGPHGRPQDRRVGGPARRGVGGGPARPGHRAGRHRHRVPGAARPGRRRVAAAHRADRAGPRRRARGGRGQPGRRARQAVVLPRPRHAEPAGRRDPRGRHRRAAGPDRAAAQAAGRRGPVRPGPQAPAAVPARLHRPDHRAGVGRRARRGVERDRRAGRRCGSGSSTPRPRARWPCRRSSTRSARWTATRRST